MSQVLDLYALPITLVVRLSSSCPRPPAHHVNSDFHHHLQHVFHKILATPQTIPRYHLRMPSSRGFKPTLINHYHLPNQVQLPSQTMPRRRMSNHSGHAPSSPTPTPSPGSAPRRRQSGSTDFTNLTPQVIEYLMKKGYVRTEQVLRQESAQVDKDGRPIFDRAEYGNEKYIKAFELLSGWIDSNLDIYKVRMQTTG